MKEHQIQITLKDIRVHPKARQELLNLGGKTQVPCLMIEGKALYESSDIIAWLENHLKKQR